MTPTLCPICGNEDCDCTAPDPQWWMLGVVVVLIAASVWIGLCITLLTNGSIDTPAPLPTWTPMLQLTATALPISASTPQPTVTPMPTRVLNPAVAMTLDNAGLEVLYKLVEAEASGMGDDGKTLVSCNVLADLYDVGGDWSALVDRWEPLGNILNGDPPRQSTQSTHAVVNGAVDGRVCLEYPRCRFLAPPSTIEHFRVAGYFGAGRYQYWLADSGQALVCVEGVPELQLPKGE